LSVEKKLATSARRKSDSGADFDAVIIGAGFAGLYALYRLRALGLRVRVFEAGDDIGGTWFWNRYPGARCDVDSVEYSFSFSEPLQQEWKWPERYSSQGDILRYINHVADRFDLRPDVQTKTRVLSAILDKQDGLWTIRTSDGKARTARFCIMATGNLSLPRVPEFKGLWPNETVDFSGLRVGVVGTGSSGVQIIPLIAKEAGALLVFQRTANFSVPARNRPLTEEELQEHKQRYGFWRAQAQNTPFGIAGHPPPTKNALEDTEDVRNAVYEEKWKRGGSISFLYSYKDLLTDQAANDTAADFARSKIRQIVRDPGVADLLSPIGYPIGARRLCLDTGYYETFNLPNVELVDVKANPIEEITANGVRTAKAEYPLDAIVFATGFDAITGALMDIDIRGREGLSLKEKWKHGPQTYLGLMTAGFPNFFIITGPGSPSVKANMVCAIEQHVNWISDCIGMLETEGHETIEPIAEAETEWVEYVNDTADATLYPLADSWYTGSNVPGKARVFMPYVGGYHTYKAICDDVVRDGYRGFEFSDAAAKAWVVYG
jgi:cyclohexanone monooxygenase